MTEIFKTAIKFKTLVQNVQKILDETSDRKEHIWQILDCFVHCFCTVTNHKVFFVLNLFKKFIKYLEMNLNLFPAIVTNISVLFSVIL